MGHSSNYWNTSLSKHVDAGSSSSEEGSSSDGAKKKATKVNATKPPAKRGRGRPRVTTKKKKASKVKEYEFSVTIVAGSQDIDKAIMGQLDKFLENECLASWFGLEKGENAKHLHIQGVIRIRRTWSVNANSRIKKAIG